MPIETGAIGDSEWDDEAYNTVHTVTSQLDTHNKTEKKPENKNWCANIFNCYFFNVFIYNVNFLRTYSP